MLFDPSYKVQQRIEIGDSEVNPLDLNAHLNKVVTFMGSWVTERKFLLEVCTFTPGTYDSSRKTGLKN